MGSKLFPVALLNTDLVRLDDLKTSVASPSDQYGHGLFEGVMAYPSVNGGLNVVALRQHLERMFTSARELYPETKVPVTIEQALEDIRWMLQANSVNEQVYIRPSLLVRGPGDVHGEPIDGNPEFSFSAYAQPCTGILKPGLRCVLSTMRKPSAVAAHHKLCGLYVYFNLANHLATEAGYDEGIMLDQNGLVAEGVFQNLLLEWHGMLFTPETSGRPILPGITMRVIRRLLKLHLPSVGTIAPADVTPRMLREARSVLLAGTASEVNYVREITWDHWSQVINNGQPTPFAEQIISLYHRFVRGELGPDDLLFRV